MTKQRLFERSDKVGRLRPLNLLFYWNNESTRTGIGVCSGQRSELTPYRRKRDPCSRFRRWKRLSWVNKQARLAERMNTLLVLVEHRCKSARVSKRAQRRCARESRARLPQTLIMASQEGGWLGLQEFLCYLMEAALRVPSAAEVRARASLLFYFYLPNFNRRPVGGRSSIIKGLGKRRAKAKWRICFGVVGEMIYD